MTIFAKIIQFEPLCQFLNIEYHNNMCSLLCTCISSPSSLLAKTGPQGIWPIPGISGPAVASGSKKERMHGNVCEWVNYYWIGNFPGRIAISCLNFVHLDIILLSRKSKDYWWIIVCTSYWVICLKGKRIVQKVHCKYEAYLKSSYQTQPVHAQSLRVMYSDYICLSFCPLVCSLSRIFYKDIKLYMPWKQNKMCLLSIYF